MRNKHVVKADGSVEIVPFTAAEEAQAEIDEQLGQKVRAEREAMEQRRQTYLADLRRRELANKLKTLPAAELETYARARIDGEGLTAITIDLLKLVALQVRE